MTFETDADVNSPACPKDENVLPEWETPKIYEISIVEDTQSSGASASDFLTVPHS